MTAQSFRPVALIAALLFVPATLAQNSALSSISFDGSQALPTSVTAASTLALLDQTDDVLAMLWSNPVAVAEQAYSPDRATGDFSRFALATTSETGRYQSHETVGAAPATLDRTYTYARVHFAKASVTLRLTWKHGQLVTVTRSPIPEASEMLARR
ncbi:MAG: hypothetical protein AAGN64_01170 [Bacteroidota bacterium]